MSDSSEACDAGGPNDGAAVRVTHQHRFEELQARVPTFGSHDPVEGEATMVEPVTLEVFTDYI